MRHGRRDSTHAPIRERLRELGASVRDDGDSGDDKPDLLVGFCGRDYQVECKSLDGELSEGQAKFHQEWRGAKPVVLRSVEEAQAWYLLTRAQIIKGDK